MEVIITVATPESAETLVAKNGLSKIGSDKSAELRINHHEIAGHAANIEVRGSSILFQNKNDFPVYMGQTEVLPGSWLEWDNQVIQLSRSITLQVTDIRNETKEIPELTGKAKTGIEPGAAQKKIVQLGIIAMCVVGSVFMLSTENQAAPKTEETFAGLIQPLNEKMKLTDAESRLRRHLQEAWVTDLRWQEQRPETVVDFYQLVLSLPEIENAKPDTYEMRVRDFAKTRLESLRTIR